MGNRLSKIVTKTGDSGTTGIAGNIRLEKYHPRIETIGLIDELNSLIGIGIADLNEAIKEDDTPLLRQIIKEWSTVQHQLFNLGGELSMPGTELIKEKAVTQLEEWLTDYNEQLPPLKEFILPGGTPTVAKTHYIRAISRKVERALWELNSHDPLNPHSLKYLNRLSDYFFVTARMIAKEEKSAEIFWQKTLVED
ncbi:cob(I)yrinic acid a,c-diamide adenosyltransferase [Ignatzschineria indica]|uniref:cob(I)yrinic acid a,c-diamide adenosyltransferase n=1 Tax=Ignatzschineria indica TaxID=472583 RepID=UPI0025782514|nr:cob(I)yrinic acid a,c-diamide adenosyltransferase [Ignatzschineria indica]MDM1546053.1 cob(I)yrinic acid a,c-diamide adenosyltransferase [Ignatzschineria indica]